MNMYEQDIIGFDAKPLQLMELWDEGRRLNFLIKTDITQYISVCTMGCPSIFETLPVSSRPIMNDWYRPFWPSLPELKKSLHTLIDPRQTPYCIIGITVIHLEPPIIPIEYSMSYRLLSPNKIAIDWDFLGYDIAGSGFISSLTNMGYGSDPEYDRSYFLEHLNNYHLFSNFDIALEYLKWSEGADAIHGPYHIYGIYKVE